MSMRKLLESARIHPEVFDLRPDYRALLIAVEGIQVPPETEGLLAAAEQHAKALLSDSAVEQLPSVAAWREAYRAFGAKPQRTRNSLEALLRRADAGLPRVNPLTDLYNAISVLHQVPIGGEDLDRYQGAPRLLRASGDEPFDTVAAGEPVTEHPESGEVVWCDDAGVTCRRWNWRQARRTQLSDETTSALFIFDALAPMSDAAVQEAAHELQTHVTRGNPQASWAQRMIAGPV